MTAVIFSHQRCGSSNLIHFLVAAYGLSLSEPDYYEPLNLRRMASVILPGRTGTTVSTPIAPR